MQLRKSILIVAFFSLISTGYSQLANIRGFVYQKENGEPAIFTTVYLQGTTHGAVSDINGYYSITKVPPGNYTLMVTSLGNDTLKEEISVKAADFIQLPNASV